MKNLKYFQYIFLLFFLLFSIETATSQNIGRDVISSQGGQTTKDGLNLSWTIGQAGLVGTSTSNTLVLSSGFEQENDQLFVTILEIDQNQFEISVFPNPASSEIKLNTIAETSASYNYSILDMNGKNITKKENITVVPGNNEETINLSSLAAGSYFIQIQLKTSNTDINLSTLKIIKL